MAEEREYLHIPGHIPIKEAAEKMGLSDKRVLQYILEKRLPAHKVQGRYMIPLTALEEFQHKPHGRIRTTPTPWRVYRAGASVHMQHIEVLSYPDKQQALREKLLALPQEQKHLFPGTMQRYISIDRGEPPCVRILLIWKDTELPDEATLEHALEVFKLDFAELLDWQSVRNIETEAIVHT
ncbi:MAG TPA: helix-turn-helix domain-containing protein [Ktedonobacteraceae bacterium]|nr:helix-turn-helix domain-containing protein [Ktedonobacteraceae bacterium]